MFLSREGMIKGKQEVESFLKNKPANYLEELSKQDLSDPVPLGNSGFIKDPMDSQRFWGK